jgi:hypothetical protein
MLPRATTTRSQRESTAGKVGGRTQEIQRLIGRSLRAVTKLEELGERTITLDCDVIQADGGTRTASISGAFVALVLALKQMRDRDQIRTMPVQDYVAATSVGIVEGEDGEPLDVGRKTRSIPLPLKRALRSRDGGCRFPGCDRTRFTQGHHVKHWIDGGETKLSNLVSLCGFHHKLVHEGGFGIAITDDGVFVFTRPDGRRIPECGRNPCTTPAPGRFSGSASPPENRVPDGTLQITYFEDALRSCMERLNPGVPIDAHTSRCKWLGERMDYSTAIEGMQYRDGRAGGTAGTVT